MIEGGRGRFQERYKIEVQGLLNPSFDVSASQPSPLTAPEMQRLGVREKLLPENHLESDSG